MNQNNQKTLTTKNMNKIEKFAEAIKEHEGFFEGSRSFRNNNPGNLKFVGQEGATREETGTFAVFKTYQDGWNALIKQITRAVTGKSQIYQPEMTILEFFQKYAPSEDNNNPTNYATIVANKCGMSINDPIKKLLEETEKESGRNLKIIIDENVVFETTIK